MNSRFSIQWRLILRTLPILVLAATASCKRDNAGPIRVLEPLILDTADGFQLSGSLYRVDKASPPTLILLHMYQSDKKVWRLFAQEAQRRGYMCLAFDMRGHGQSRSENWKPDSLLDPLSDGDLLNAKDDIALIKKQALESGGDPDNIFLIGASIGANLALSYAKDDSEIPGVVLLSPGLKYKNIVIEETIKEFGRRPVFIAAGEGDNYSASSSRTLKKSAPGYSDLKLYPGTAHGTDMLDVYPSLIDEIFQWLEPIITKNPTQD